MEQLFSKIERMGKKMHDKERGWMGRERKKSVFEIVSDCEVSLQLLNPRQKL